MARNKAFPVRGFLALAVAIGAFADQLPVRSYTTADGLAGNTIDRILRDSRGFLWFCTREGLSRYDGYQFRNFGVDQGLPPVDADLIESPAGDFWVATGDGVAHFRPADANPHFTIYRPDGAAERDFQILAADPDGGIWAGAPTGLYRLDPPHLPANRDWRLHRVEIGLPRQNFEDSTVEALLVDRRGTLWVGARSGLYRRFRDGRGEGTRAGPLLTEVTSLLQDRDGAVWVGTRHGVCRVDPDRSLAAASLAGICAPRPDLAGEVIHFLYQSADGVYWAGSDGLLAAWGPGIEGTARYSARNGLPGQGTSMTNAAEDLGGNLWVAGFGAIRIAKDGFRTYGEADGLDSGHVESIFEDRAGDLCAITEGAHGRMVNRFDGRQFRPVRPGVPAKIAWGWGSGQLALEDRAGQWWIPTASGIYRFPHLPAVEQLAGARATSVYEAANSAYTLFQDSQGGVWISLQILAGPYGPTRANALARWDPATGTLRRYSDADGVPSGELAAAFAEDRSGGIWIGMSEGSLLRFENGRFRRVSLPYGKPAWVNALHVDRSGRLWVATHDGATVLDSSAPERPATTYTTADGLLANNVKCIAEDLAGRVYLGGGHGVDRVDLAGSAPRIRHYTTADGLARGEIQAAFRDRSGTLWFGTREGLSRLEPEAERAEAPPAVFITAIRVRGTSRPVSTMGESELSGLRLGPDQNQVGLEFGSLRFGAGETLRYQYRIAGRDADWSAATEERTVNYANLAPGRYRWQVRALTADGVPSDRPATLEFTILPPLWQRWWLQLLVAAALCAILYSLYRYRLDRLLEMERLRTRIATDLHDDIGSTLSQIAILSEVAQRQPANGGFRQPLKEIAGLSRELVDSMSDIVWAIDPEQDRLEDLTHRMRRLANDLFSYNGVEVRFQAPHGDPELRFDAETRRQVFLIFKEALHNAVRHANCHCLEIQVEQEAGWLKLALTDDGTGFDPEKVQRGHGLASMRQRAERAGGRLTVESAPGRGSRLEMCIPVRRRKPSPHPALHKWVGDLGRISGILKDREK